MLPRDGGVDVRDVLRRVQGVAILSARPLMLGIASVANLPPGHVVRTGLTYEGEASWYGAEFHGRSTTSGERFDTFFAHTAAHRELPFGTWLLVSHTGRELMVRINDRGPFHGERFLDLTWAGAMVLGIDGVAQVTAEVCVPGA
jgi:rare lipoprotein A (peptidoglycan hydrolase)